MCVCIERGFNKSGFEPLNCWERTYASPNRVMCVCIYIEREYNKSGFEPMKGWSWSYASTS